LLQNFAPLQQDLQESLGREVLMVTAPDRESFRDRTLKGEYDLIWTCNSCYFEAHQGGLFQAIAAGEPGFQGVVVVPVDSPIRSIEDLNGHSVVAVEEWSLAGYLFLAHILHDMGILEEVEFSFYQKSMDQIPFRVLKGEVSAGVFSEAVMAKSAYYRSIRDQLRVIGRSVTIPQFPFAVSNLVSQEDLEMIQRALLRQNPQLLKNLEITRIRLVDDQYYSRFRDYYYKIKRFQAQ